MSDAVMLGRAHNRCIDFAVGVEDHCSGR